MSDPFLAEIRIVSFTFAPKGWAFCNGQLLRIDQNQALFSLLGTTYGGDGRTNFALPNLQARAPMHVGLAHVLGEAGGEDAHTLSLGELPAHAHPALASSTAGSLVSPGGDVLAAGSKAYGHANSLTKLRSGTVKRSGGGSPHENMQPFLVLHFVIALQGIFPSPN